MGKPAPRVRLLVLHYVPPRPMRRTRIGLGTCALALLAGCATAPPDDLLGSTAVVERLARERAAVVEVARFSQKRANEPLPERWKAYVVVPWKPRTQYALVESEGQVALEARSERAASGLYRYVRVRPQTHPTLEWRWRVPRLIDGADPREAGREDSPVRVVVSFHGDAARLDEGDRSKMRLAKVLSGRAMPYATLMYIWSNDLPVGTVVQNPHISRVRMIVAEKRQRKAGALGEGAAQCLRGLPQGLRRGPLGRGCSRRHDRLRQPRNQHPRPLRGHLFPGRGAAPLIRVSEEQKRPGAGR